MRGGGLVELAAFCAFNGMGALIPMLYTGAPEDIAFVEAVAERVEREIERAKG